MKTLSWSPSSLEFSVNKGSRASLSAVLSIDTHSALIKQAILNPAVVDPFMLKSVSENLHIHPAYEFQEGVKYWLKSDKTKTTDKDEAVFYLGEGGSVFEFKPLTLNITTVPGIIFPDAIFDVGYDYSAVWNIEVYYQINDEDAVFYGSYAATGSVEIDTTGIVFEHEDLFKIIIKDQDSVLSDSITYTVAVGSITIDSINGGLPLTYEGLFEDGMWYFADTTGTKVVDQNDPDVSNWFVGTGNADGDIDLDIKMLAITDVVIPETVQLGVAFDVSGNYVMLEDKIVIEGYNGSAWVKLHVGDYIEVTGGSFTESVTLQSADGFTVNNAVTVRVRSYDGYALNGIDSTNINSTITANPIILTAGVPGTVSGTSDGIAVQVFYKLQPAGEWTCWGNAYTNEFGAWETDEWTLETAGTYDFRISDFHIPGWYIDVPDVVVASASIVETLSMGSYFGIAVWGGRAYGWGSGNAGVLGNGGITVQPRPYPVAVDVASSLYGKTVKKVSCGGQHTLFLCTDGTVHACGDTVSSGVVGDGGTTNRLKPVAVAVDAESSLNGKTVVDISAGLYHSIALDSDGGVHAWGSNTYGEIGDNTTTIRRKPVAVSTATSLNGKTVTKVFGGTNRSFCVCADGTAHGWGYNNEGQIGDNSTTNRPRPVAVSMATSLNGKKVIYVAPQGRVSTIFLADDGTVHGCGQNIDSEIGDNTTTQRNQPVATNAGASSSLYGKTAKHITACWNSYTSHCVCSDGSIHAWGYNDDTGQLGDNSANYTVRAIPVAVSTATSLAGKTVVQCSDGLANGACLCSDGSAHGWGYNTWYQIGDNTNINRRQPVAVDKTLVV